MAAEDEVGSEEEDSDYSEDDSDWSDEEVVYSLVLFTCVMM